LITQLNDESQHRLKSFVEWLSERKGKTISYDQIKDNWAKNRNFERDSRTLGTFIQIAKSQKLIAPISDKNWVVSEG
jgi:hypothetical protein